MAYYDVLVTNHGTWKLIALLYLFLFNFFLLLELILFELNLVLDDFFHSVADGDSFQTGTLRIL